MISPDFIHNFVMSPITWIVLIIGVPPVFAWELKLLHKQIDKYFPDERGNKIC